ncbi:MAG: DUF3859 domain-containing protein [bacterium]|nr:DUF3859 domain-containing protein [bacterium]
MKKIIILLITVFSIFPLNLNAQCLNGDCKNSFSTMSYASGSIYIGNCKDGKEHGRGTYYFFNGSKYEGEWEKGKPHGEGIWFYSNGLKYTGTFNNGHIEGNGIYQKLRIKKDDDIKAAILLYGIAKGEVDFITREGGKTSQEIYWNMKNITITKKTDEIPLLDGTIMYLSFIIYNLPEGNMVDGFKAVTIHPPLTDENGETSAYHSENFYLEKLNNCTISHEEQYWTFSNKYPYEMVPGEWTFQIWYKNRLLVEKKFIGKVQLTNQD